MSGCIRCRSYAINHHLHGRDGSEPDLCDVCYWRAKAEAHKPPATLATVKPPRGLRTKVPGVAEIREDV